MSDADPQWVRRFQAYSRAAAWLTVALGASVLLGWAFRLDTLKSALPGLTPMKVPTAVAFVLAGLALHFWRLSRAEERSSLLGRLLGALTGLLAVAALVLEPFLPTEVGPAVRPSLLASLSFGLLGLALLLMNTRSLRKAVAVDTLTFAGALIAFLGLLDYLLAPDVSYTGMALHTAFGLTLLATAILSARIESGPVSLFASDSHGGEMARQLLPAAVLVPMVLGWLRLQGQATGLYSIELGTALFVIAVIAILAMLVWWNARSLDESDALRRRAQDELRRAAAELSDLYNRAPCGYHSLDADGVFVQINDTELAWLGYQREEIVGKARFLDLITPAGRQVFHRNFPQLLERGYVRDLEFDMLRKDGSILPVLLNASAIYSVGGQFLRSRSTLFDITERRRQQQHIEQQNRELEQRNREVERATQLKSQFLANMSHELRTPLNSILGFSELLADEVPGPLNDKQKHFVKRIREGGQHLLQLINDILDLSKIEAGKLDLHPEVFELRATLPEVVSVIRPLAMAKQIHVRSDIPAGLMVYADRVRVKQILYNLLSNAVKFTPNAGEVAVECASQGTAVEISVTDTGIGIRPEDQAAVFEEFRQVGATTKGTTEGTGLGLTITRRLAEQQGGSIRLQSALGKGSRFTLSLPAVAGLPAVASLPAGAGLPVVAGLPAPAPQPPLAAELPVHVGPEPMLVLVVDDEPATCELLVGCLETEGYRVAVATSLGEAMDKAVALQPVAVTLDILMPDGNGFGVLYELRNRPETAHIPVIVVSVVDERNIGFALGAADYLVKPVEKETLLRSLARHVRPTDSTRPRLLVVDDEPESLDLVAAILRSADYAPVLVQTGQHALSVLASETVHAIILDLIMPHMDGFELLARLKQSPELRDIPVFVLTAKDLSRQELDLLARKTRAVFYKKDAAWREELLRELRRLAGPGAQAARGANP